MWQGKLWSFFCTMGLAVLLTACGGGGGGAGNDSAGAPKSYAVGGSISGLNNWGLVLSMGGQTISPSAGATSFTFPSLLSSDTSYEVQVSAMPIGMTCAVGKGSGVIGTGNVVNVEVSCHSVLTVLYSFASTATDGSHPQSIIQSSDSSFHGVTRGGGNLNHGTVFTITPEGVETVLYSFGDFESYHPHTLMQASDGNFYGIAGDDSAGGDGTVFRVDPNGTETILKTFSWLPTPDGTGPNGLIEADDGALYGTTRGGGDYGEGVLFKISNTGVFSVLHSFGAYPGEKGKYPMGPLVQGYFGYLYAITGYGGSQDKGAVVAVSLNGAEVVPYSFKGVIPDQIIGFSSLIQGADGNLYGTIDRGGDYSNGVFFRISFVGASAVYEQLHSFSASEAVPRGLIQGGDGNFYGVASGVNMGALFKITPSGKSTLLYLFGSNVNEGIYPASLIQGRDGNLYGTTSDGGRYGGGTFFRVSLQ